MTVKTIKLNSKLEPALRSGHPWLYRNHLPKHKLKDGDWVKLSAGGATRVGLYDAHSAIAIRFFANELPDREFIHKRVKDALALRENIASDTTAYRLIYGESDFLPGLVTDKYGRFVVLKTYSSSLSTILDDVVWALKTELNLKGILLRKSETLEALWGELPPEELTISENGLKFIANLYKGQKTGLFLDQRENRQTVRRLAKDKTVLNLFSYNGGFSVYALAGGASYVKAVDIAEAANLDANKNVVLNNFEPSKHEAITADVFDILSMFVQQRESFDIVILDPPTLAKDKQNRMAAIRAYRKLNMLAMRVVKKGGLLFSASCTSQVSEAEFKDMLKEAAFKRKLKAQIIHQAGHALDHPVPLSFKEARYLKFIGLRIYN